MKLGNKFICKSGKIYFIGESTNKNYDFDIYDDNNRVVNCCNDGIIESLIAEHEGFYIDVGENKDDIYEIPLRFI